MLIAQLAVVFVGITGDHSDAVQRQVVPSIRKAHVQRVLVSDDEIQALTHHTGESREIVKKLDSDGVIGGEIVLDHGKPAFRFVVYDGKGNLRSLGETPLVAHQLTSEDLDVFETNLTEEVGSLQQKAHHLPAPVPTPEPAPKPVALPVARVTPTKKTATAARTTLAIAPAAPSSAADDDNDAPPGLGDPHASAHHAAAHAAHVEAAAPVVATADTGAVSMGEIEALTGAASGIDSDASATAAVEHEPAQPGVIGDLHLQAAAGIGLAGRAFAPGPSTVTGYTTAPVGTVRFDAAIQPTVHTSLELVAERTLKMTTPLADGMATTAMSRWEVVGGYTFHGALDVTPFVGAGHRSFTISSADPSRSPDNDYKYAVIGARAAKTIGSKVTLRANVAFEPVVGGVEPTEMAFGDAQRWAIAAGASIDVRPIAHVFARLAVDVQRFSWTWDAGSRGAGGAVDTYPSGLVSVGAEY